MPMPRYKLPLISFGAEQSDGGEASTMLSLASTGSSTTYATVGAHSTIHHGAMTYDSDSEVVMWLAYRRIPWDYNPFFRIRDVTNGVTIMHATPPYNYSPYMLGLALDNPWPAGNAKIDLQYAMADVGGTLEFYSCLVQVHKW